MLVLRMRFIDEPMTCQGMLSWTFSGLIGAFVDLTIAYFLLCASAVVFFASKFLGIFGLSLPCPCNGIFVYPNKDLCLQSLLIDGSVERVSSVQLSVKNKFPFGSSWERDRNYQLNMKLIGDKDSRIDGLVEIEGEASSSNMDGKDLVLRNESNMGLGVTNSSPDFKEEKFDFKGKENINQRPKISLRRRRKITDYGKTNSNSEIRTSCSDCRSPYGNNYNGFRGFECSSEPVDSGFGFNQFQNGDASVTKNSEKSSSPCLELESVDENNPTVKTTSSSEGINSHSQIELHLNNNEKNEIKILEQALEQEHAARSALCLELEKERSAAASAADEAMSMILRLQEEKASVEMEARQFQRMIEEKSTYDAEEMNILKEIIVRREREKHFLEKEVESYRAIVYDGNTSGEISSTLYLSDDPDLMLQQLSQSIDDHGKMKNKISFGETASTSEQKYRFSDKIVIVSEEQEENGVDNETPDVIDVTFDAETPVHDVHVVDNKFGLPKDNNLNEPIRGRSNSSDLIIGLPPKVPHRRSNSISGTDNERVKIDSEVGWLRERLRIVQEGRDKLNFSMERQERELFQVQLLEDIASQLREIRQLTSPGKVVRQASLPLLPPKVMSKKRRHRSVSVGVHKN